MVILRGKIWKFGDNINTDLIVSPEYLTSNDSQTIINHAFENIKPEFAKNVKKGDIIIAGKNFGSGSSREEAVFVVKELGISAIIAKSFSRIYFRNLINLGIPAITIPDLDDYFIEGDSIEIDLEKGIISSLKNESVKNFNPLPTFIMNIISDGGAIKNLKKELSYK